MYVKKLMYTVRVDAPNPAFGNMLLEQFVDDSTCSGEDGEIDARGPWNEGASGSAWRRQPSRTSALAGQAGLPTSPKRATAMTEK